MPSSVVFAGVVTWDTVMQLPCLPAPDGRVVAEAMSTCGGGPAATAAVTAARLGLAPELIAAVGDDPVASRIRCGLRAEGVGTVGVRTAPGATSGACTVLVDRPRGARSICVLPGPELRIADGSGEAAAVRAADWLHVDHAGLPAVEPLLAALPSGAPRPVVCYDAGNLNPRRCPAAVDVYVPTLQALREVYGDRAGAADVPGLLTAALADGARTVVATDGAHGAYAADGAGVWHVPGHRGVEVLSTLGAGDVFHGALVTALVRRTPLPEALAYANAVAALSCRALDGRSGIPSDTEAQALADRLPASRLTLAAPTPTPIP